MKNRITYERGEPQKDSFHSQICTSNDSDLIYRKSYNGDWGHWDDLPDRNDNVEDDIHLAG